MMEHLREPVNFRDKKHLASILVVIFVLLAIPVTVVSVLNSREASSQASSVGLHPNDSLYSAQWSLAKIRAPFAWEVEQGSPTIKVAVIDTGIDYLNTNAAEFSGQLGTGYNAVTAGGSTDDDYGSYGAGTRVASVIGSKTNNANALAGTAWNTTMLPVKVCGATGACTADDLIEGINWSVANGAKVMIISVTLPTTDPKAAQITAAVNSALSAGVIVISMSGNVAVVPIGLPANIPGVITVGATDPNDVVASFSGRGPELDLVAPGTSIPTLVRSGCCLNGSGTNLAAAHVAGAAALLLSEGVSAAQIPNLLYQSAQDLGAAGRDDIYGNGRLDICGALNAAGKTCPIPDLPPTFADIKANGSDAAISIAYNTAATITWTSQNATGCSVTPSGWTGTSGSQSTGNLTTSRTYTLSCTGVAGSATDSVQVNVFPQGDTQNPTVSIIDPGNGSLLKGNSVPVAATAADNVGVSRVDFLVDGNLRTSDTSSPYQYIWDTTLDQSTAHSLTARAFDAAGNNQLSSPVSVTVDNQAPVVDITSPLNGATVSGTVNITADAIDQTSVSRVEFLIDGQLLGNDTTSPYAAPWNSTGLVNGNHFILARAFDILNNLGTDTISVNVQNADTQKPTAPNLSGNVSGTNANLSWTASTDNVGVVGYYLYRNNVLITQTSASNRSYTDNPPCGAIYNYVVRAFDAAGNVSDPSNTVSLTVTCPADTQAPTVPGNLTAAAVSTSQINLAWNPSTDNVGVAGYEIYRNSTKVATIGSVTSFGDTGLTASTTYSYFVKAFDGAAPANVSGASNTASATTQTPPLTNGAIVGVVSSSAGGVVAGAKVNTTVAGVKRTVVTSSTGSYNLTNVPPGNYGVKYSLKQYVTQTAAVTVASGTPTTKNVTLQRR